MKVDKLVGDRFRERPADCVVDSHAIGIRGGYMKYVANGIYSLFMPLKRVSRKIEQIIREEMDAIDGQEVQFPVIMPASLWEESGRYASIGKELARFTDRNGTPMVLGMTHEEAAVQLVREYGQSYTKYPFMIYQFQTKFRDEARPRAGLIRVREFIMKDAYSFHTSQEDLEDYYRKVHKAYERIYSRVGLPDVVSVASDSGMMGGNVSHEFMLLTPIGEDSIVLCGECDYRANMEAAERVPAPQKDDVSEPLKLVETPDIHSIEDVCSFLGMEQAKSCKAVVYQKNADDSYVVIFTRGDLEVNETKLTNLLGEAVHPAVITEESGLHTGYIGPVKLDADVTVLYDRSLEGTNNLACGANQNGYHYTGLDMSRDVPEAEYHDLAKVKDGDVCPHCGKPALTVSRGIEVGNIFQLGTKYTDAMGMTFLDADGETKHPVMGSYGIGVGRVAASIVEAHHDEHGPVWPLSVAPWQVEVCAVRADNPEVKACADALYEDLKRMGVEVIYDDRQVSAGVMFSDADLIGAPYRAVVSPRNLKQNVVELSSRDKSYSSSLPAGEAAAEIAALVHRQLQEINAAAAAL